MKIARISERQALRNHAERFGLKMLKIVKIRYKINRVCWNRIERMEKMGGDSEKNINFKLNAKAICALFFIIGIGLIAVSNVPFEDPASWWSSWGKATANNAGTTLLVAGVISFLMEISTINSFFQGLLKNILNDQFPFDAYSKENLVNFRNAISAYLSDRKMDAKELSQNTIYSYEDKLLELSKGLYYEYHTAKYTVYPQEGDGKIRINATLDYKIINRFGEKNEIRFKTKTYADSEMEAKNSFRLQKLVINKQSINTDNLVSIEKIEKQEDSNFYDYKVKIKKDLGKAKSTTVHMEYEYFLPITDRLQNYKITLPCLKMEHEIRIKNAWELRGSAYTAFYLRQEFADSKFKIEQSASDIMRIKFNDWVFPGGGYSIYYDKKS